MNSSKRFQALWAKVFGRIQWEKPKWLSALAPRGKQAAVFFKKYRWAMLSVFGLAIGAYYASHWKPAPKPEDVILSASFTKLPEPPPPPTKESTTTPPSALMLTFNASAAPLEKIGKSVKEGIQLLPSLPGEWKWLDERQLVFTPKQDWPVGQKYKIQLHPKLVQRPHGVLATEMLEFETEPMRVTSQQVEFYQDPVDPKLKQVVGVFRFNYPLKTNTFEKNVSLVSHPRSNESAKTAHRFSITYDSAKFQANVRSEVLPMPLEDHIATLNVGAGVASEKGGAGTPAAISNTVILPGKGSRFFIQNVSLDVVRNSENVPEQVLLVQCTSDIDERTLAQAIQVWALPKYIDASQVGPDTLAKSKPIRFELIPGEREVSSLHGFRLMVEPRQAIYVRIKSGVEAYGGYVLLKNYEASSMAPEYPKELRLAHDGAILSLAGEKKLTIVSRGLPGFRTRLYRIQPSDVQHVFTMTGGTFGNMNWTSSFGLDNVSEVFVEDRKLDASRPKDLQSTEVNFAPYLKTSDSLGLFYVKLEIWDPVTNTVLPAPYEASYQENSDDTYHAEGNEPGDGEYSENSEGDDAPSYQPRAFEADGRFILLTDLGLIEKVDAKGNRWVFVQSYSTGNPVANVAVQVVAKNGTTLLTRSTNTTGVALLPPLKEFDAEKTPVLLLAKQGTDVSVLPLGKSDRTLMFSRFDVGGAYTQGKDAALSAYAFSDRGLYRPGEKVQLGALVRSADWKQSVQGLPLQLSIVDPRGIAVKTKKLVLEREGFETFEFQTEPESPTGSYHFEVQLIENKKPGRQLGSESFRVEEFLPDKLRMTSHLEPQTAGWVTQQTLKAQVELQNLFGTAAAGNRVTGEFTLTPFHPSFSRYSDYSFFAPGTPTPHSQSLGEMQTNSEGKATFEIDLSAWLAQTYLLQFYAEGFDLGGGRGVSTLTQVIVSPRKFMLGWKADGQLNFIKRGSPRKLDILAVNPQLEKTSVSKLTAVYVEQKWVSVLTRDGSGSYRYQSIMKDVTLKREPLALNAQGNTLTLPSTQAGNFFLSLRDEDDVEVLHVPFSVTGEGNVARELERNAELKLTLDKAEYQPGETITLQMTAPYAGQGVITIERDRVYAHKVFKTTTNSTVQTMEVPADLLANGYVQVAFVRSLDSPELYVSPLSYAVVPFRVLRKEQRIDLSLSSDALVRPGSQVTLRYRTDAPAKVVLFAVDEGILQVAKYSPPDPLGFFMGKRALEVETRQMVDLLLPEFSAVSKKGHEGGDSDEASLMQRNLNPFKRKVDQPAVFWSGLLDAGPQEKQLQFQVPDTFNGTLKVMAVAASPEALATASSKTLVRGPFVVTPNLPTFVAPGDRVSFTAAIANNVEGSGNQASIKVDVTTNSGFSLVGAASQTVVIPEGREGTVAFEVQATEALGDGEVRFRVKGKNEEVTRIAHVSVRPHSLHQVVSQAGLLRADSKTLALKRSMYKPLSTRELEISLLPLGLGISALGYLENYPHLCSEQLMSRAVPALVLQRRTEWGDKRKVSAEAFNRTVDILTSRQNERGGFGYWAANGFESEPLNVYVTLLLTEAKDRQLPLPNQVREKALEQLQRQVELPLSTVAKATERAQALYVLARNEKIMPAPTADLADYLKRQPNWKSLTASFYLAATFSLTHQTDKATAWIDALSVAETIGTQEGEFLDAHAYQAQVLYLVSIHFPQKMETLAMQALTRLVESISLGYHSLSAGWTLLALDTYAQALEKQSADGKTLSHVEVEFQDSTGGWKKQTLPAGLTATLPLTEQAKAVRLKGSAGTLVFYSLTEAGFDKEVSKKVTHEGLEVMHQYEDGSGKVISSTKLGDEVTVRIRTRAVKGSLSNVAMVDLLPAGFEVVLASGPSGNGLSRLEGSTSTWTPQHLDVREDRVILYGDVDTSAREITYKLKAVARGVFLTPPIYASGMYAPAIRAESLSGQLTVQAP